MANPKRRHSNSRTRKRRSHDYLMKLNVSVCSNCGTAIMPHRICPNCGYYNGRQVVQVHAPEAGTKAKG